MPFHRLLPLALAASLATAPLAAQEAFIWVYDAEFAIFPSDSQLNLIAIQPGADASGPENDLPSGLIWGHCQAEFDSGEIALRFEAFAGAAQAGDPVAFTLSGSDGSSFTLSATIVNRGFDPTGGAEIIVEAGGPEMTMLANSDIVTYGVVGLTDFILDFDLSTNRAYVAEFDEDCGDLAAGGALQRPAAPSGPAAALFPDVGPDITGHVWTRFTEVSEDNVFDTFVEVFYGVPETDDVLVRAQCVIGAQGPLVSFQVAADIAGLADGDAATLRATAADGRSVEIPGSVIGSFAEIGISGIEASLDVSDPAWLVLATSPVLALERVGGAGGFTLTGNGPNTLGPFLADCANIDQLEVEGGTRPSAPIGAQAGYLACDNFGRVSSRDTGQAINLNFVNESSGFRGLTWIDPDGVPVNMGGLNPGQATAFTTDPGHVWMATDGPGNCLEMIQPDAGQSEYRLTVE